VVGKMSNFPQKYFFVFANNPDSEIHHNNMNAGLRLALTLLMDEYEVYILLTEKAIFLAKKQDDKLETDVTDDEVSFTPYELLDGIISFGGHVMTCKSSLTLTDLKAEEIIDGVEILHLQKATKIMIDCNQVLVF
jgi:predicted peroxiredoxin